MSGSPFWLLFLTLVSLKATDVAEDGHVVDTDSLSVPQQPERFTAKNRPAQLVPPLGHTGGNRHEYDMVKKKDIFVFCFMMMCTMSQAFGVLLQIPENKVSY